MRSNKKLPKSVKEEYLLDKKNKNPETQTVFEIAIEFGLIDSSIAPKTIKEWTCLSDKQLFKVRNNLKVELGLAIMFCVGIGATYQQTQKIIWRALGYDLGAPPLYDYDYALRKACSIEEKDIGERVYCLKIELEKRNVADRCINN